MRFGTVFFRFTTGWSSSFSSLWVDSFFIFCDCVFLALSELDVDGLWPLRAGLGVEFLRVGAALDVDDVAGLTTSLEAVSSVTSDCSLLLRCLTKQWEEPGAFRKESLGGILHLHHLLRFAPPLTPPFATVQSHRQRAHWCAIWWRTVHMKCVCWMAACIWSVLYCIDLFDKRSQTLTRSNSTSTTTSCCFCLLYVYTCIPLLTLQQSVGLINDAVGSRHWKRHLANHYVREPHFPIVRFRSRRHINFNKGTVGISHFEYVDFRWFVELKNTFCACRSYNKSPRIIHINA